MAETKRDDGRFTDIHLAGQSAGGNLAAAAVLRGLHTGHQPVRSLLLEVPVLDLTAVRAVDKFTPEVLLAGLQECMDLYAPEHGARSDELISPVHAVDLVGHPATTIMTAEHDVLRFDGERYADRLHRAGVPVRYLEVAGHLHGSSMLTRSLPEARSWRETAHQQLRGLSAQP